MEVSATLRTFRTILALEVVTRAGMLAFLVWLLVAINRVGGFAALLAAPVVAYMVWNALVWTVELVVLVRVDPIVRTLRRTLVLVAIGAMPRLILVTYLWNQASSTSWIVVLFTVATTLTLVSTAAFLLNTGS